MGVGAEANAGQPSFRLIAGAVHCHLGWGNTPGLGPVQMASGWHASCDVTMADLAGVLQVVEDIDAGAAAVSAIDMALQQAPSAAQAWAAASTKAGNGCGQPALNLAAYRALRRLLY